MISKPFKPIDIVHVRFENPHRPGTFSGAKYSYIADYPLAVGDIVNVPTKYGERKACVVDVHVPVFELGCKVGDLRHITEPATIGGDLFAEFYN